MSDTPYDSSNYPRMVLACAQGRGVDEGFKLERELAAYQEAMPVAPKRLTMTRNLASGMATETVVAAHDYDALAKRCARLTVELEAARKNATSTAHGFHETSGFYEDDALAAGKEKA